MSWIVPSLAAELWGMPLDHIIQGIENGSIASRHEHGFLFVRHGEHPEPQAAPVAAAAPELITAIGDAASPTIATAVAEISAIGINPLTNQTPSGQPNKDDETADDASDDTTVDSPQADQDYLNFLKQSGDWRRGRREAHKLRHPPTDQQQAKAA